MKVLFFNNPPFFLVHGGIQTLIESLMRELAALGVEVEPERWWDENQKGDIIHYISRPTAMTVRAAHQKGFKVVMTETLGPAASQGWRRRFAQRALTDLARTILPGNFLNRMGWDVYQELDAMVYLVQNDWATARYLFHANQERGHVIPNGLEREALEALARPQEEGDYLVCMATIYPVKNNVLLARAARLAGTPIVFLGKPYAEDDPYFLEFKQCVDGKVVRYAGFAAGEEKYRWLRGARGFVLFSQYESDSVAVCEAAAARLPLLLSDLPWANKVYRRNRNISFVALTSPERIAPALREFYAQAHRQPGTTFPLLTCRQVAERYLQVYQKILGRA
jgi:glycosyltransferase involved in cell wall biosynthesis